MRWKYRYKSFDGKIYIYEYVREHADIPGIIQFDTVNSKVEIIKPCSEDENYSTDAASRHFYKVVDAGFPMEYTVSCG